MACDDDIIAFIKARLDEDEATATAATPGPWRAPCGPDDDDAAIEGRDGHVVADSHSCPDHPHRGAADALHIIRHDPARILREVEAKRKILDLFMSTAALVEHPPVMGEGHPYAGKISARDYFDARRELAVLRPVAVALAAVYSDHPDYRQDWNGSSW